MNRIFVATRGPATWRAELKDPDLHWVRGRSAYETAVSWESASRTRRGIPAEIAAALDRDSTLKGAELLFAVAEHKVHLKSRGNPSQNDVWALLKTSGALISMAVEGKAGEPFDRTLAEWMADGREGKEARLASLCEIIGMTSPDKSLRYQLFHRLASAILEADRFSARHAVMMVQNFASYSAAWEDYLKFSRALGSEPVRNGICRVGERRGLSMYVGWTDCRVCTDREVVELV
jgi:hypothetical protein